MLHTVALRRRPLGARCLCGRTLPAVAAVPPTCRAATSTQHTASSITRAERPAVATTSCAIIPVTTTRAAAARAAANAAIGTAAAFLAASANRISDRNASANRRSGSCPRPCPCPCPSSCPGPSQGFEHVACDWFGLHDGCGVCCSCPSVSPLLAAAIGSSDTTSTSCGTSGLSPD